MQDAFERPITRRALIGASACALLLGAGAAGNAHTTGARTPQGLLQPESPVHSGKRITALLAANPFTVAHRGGSNDWPEMSMEAYRNSVARRVDALEISLARTVDGVWFGLHDDTLDRTSRTHGFVASAHTWQEVRRHRITRRPRAAGLTARVVPQPYLRFEELIDVYGDTHAIFVDPKSALPEQYPELFAIMESHLSTPTETFIAKSIGNATGWGDAARARGYTTWGFYYGASMESSPAELPITQGHWDLLGLDYTAPSWAWQTMRQYGKPIIGHVIPDRAAAAEARGLGAQGLMISGIAEVLG